VSERGPPAEDKEFAGVGFVFTEADPYAGTDLDGVRNPMTGVIEAWAWEIIQGEAWRAGPRGQTYSFSSRRTASRSAPTLNGL
jgi:hypothetical protein